MKIIGLLVMALALMGNNDLPPLEYQGSPPPSVIIVVPDTNSGVCGQPAPGWHISGCEFVDKKSGVPVVVMPNPCFYKEAIYNDSYAHLLCHEFGHANGWVHGDEGIKK